MNIVNMPAPTREVAVKLEELSTDAKRMLKVQWKEFVHFVEDYELERASKGNLDSEDFRRRNAA